MTDPIGPPPIKATPGNLVKIVETACANLQEVRKNDPDNFEAVWGIAVATYAATGHWIRLAGEGERP